MMAAKLLSTLQWRESLPTPLPEAESHQQTHNLSLYFVHMPNAYFCKTVLKINYIKKTDRGLYEQHFIFFAAISKTVLRLTSLFVFVGWSVQKLYSTENRI
jgi:hypothetical protein